MKNVDLKFVIRVLSVFNNFDEPDCEELWWRTDGEYAPVTFLVNCNDIFFWACSDCEEITRENVEILEQTAFDLRQIDWERDEKGNLTGFQPISYFGDLFCARVRRMRPQGAAYPKDERLWPLFDACGPERETGFGNPKPHPSVNKNAK